MPAGGAGHGGRPCSRVSAGPRAVPTTARDAADKHEHAEDQMFVDMLPGDNSPSDVEAKNGVTPKLPSEVAQCL